MLVNSFIHKTCDYIWRNPLVSPLKWITIGKRYWGLNYVLKIKVDTNGVCLVLITILTKSNRNVETNDIVVQIYVTYYKKALLVGCVPSATVAVCLGGSAWGKGAGGVCLRGQTPPHGQTPPEQTPPGRHPLPWVDTPLRRPPPPASSWLHILLECILVWQSFYWKLHECPFEDQSYSSANYIHCSVKLSVFISQFTVIYHLKLILVCLIELLIFRWGSLFEQDPIECQCKIDKTMYLSCLMQCSVNVLLLLLCNSSSFSLLTESFDVAVFTVYLVLMNVNDLFTLIHFQLFQLDII